MGHHILPRKVQKRDFALHADLNGQAVILLMTFDESILISPQLVGKLSSITVIKLFLKILDRF